MEENLIWSWDHGPGIAPALFDLLLGAQIVGVTTFLARGYRHA